jgi:hypothetical protein
MVVRWCVAECTDVASNCGSGAFGCVGEAFELTVTTFASFASFGSAAVGIFADGHDRSCYYYPRPPPSFKLCGRVTLLLSKHPFTKRHSHCYRLVNHFLSVLCNMVHVGACISMWVLMRPNRVPAIIKRGDADKWVVHLHSSARAGAAVPPPAKISSQTACVRIVCR